MALLLLLLLLLLAAAGRTAGAACTELTQGASGAIAASAAFLPAGVFFDAELDAPVPLGPSPPPLVLAATACADALCTSVTSRRLFTVGAAYFN